MSKITIKEVDLTAVEQASVDSTDVVYIPGFSSLSDNAPLRAAPRVPTLCRTISEFNSYFGSEPVTFESNQEYPNEFSSEAVPVGGIMFNAGDPDPSYIYAKELLLRGMPVIYERINTDESPITVEYMYDTLSTIFTYHTEISSEVRNSAGAIIQGASVNINTTNFNDIYPNFGNYMFTAASDISIGEISSSITNVLVDKNVFIEQFPTYATHTFTYNGSKWQENSTQYTSTQLGLTFDGTPSSNDTIQIIYGIVWYDNSGNRVDDTIMTVTVPQSVTLDDGCTIWVAKVEQEPILLDKGLYSVKYLTTGGYPVFEYNGKSISNSIANLAYKRGDAIALIDHTNNSLRTLVGVGSVFNRVNDAAFALDANVNSYAAMFTPYCTFNLSGTYTALEEGTLDLPASFAYLLGLAVSLANNPSWLAIAGATRGKVNALNSVNSLQVLTNSIADSYQPNNAIAINPITNIRPYGQCIWGNRTLVDNSAKNGTTALSYLNIRNLLCDIKKQLFIACQSLMFEQNTDKLWLSFLSMVTPTLDTMVTGYGLSGYKIIKENPSDKSTITATVRVYPVYAVESFDITVYVQNGEVSVL